MHAHLAKGPMTSPVSIVPWVLAPGKNDCDFCGPSSALVPQTGRCSFCERRILGGNTFDAPCERPEDFFFLPRASQCLCKNGSEVRDAQGRRLQRFEPCKELPIPFLGRVCQDVQEDNHHRFCVFRR